MQHVFVAGDQLRDSVGALVGTARFYIDVTDTVAAEPQVGCATRFTGAPGPFRRRKTG
jgi:hypothetical protein